MEDNECFLFLLKYKKIIYEKFIFDIILYIWCFFFLWYKICDNGEKYVIFLFVLVICSDLKSFYW